MTDNYISISNPNGVYLINLKSYPLNEDEFEVYSEKEEYERICKIRRQKLPIYNLA